MDEERLFWADQIAEEIVNRKRFRYIEKPVPRFDRFVVKTSASISGVLHIGRLSDTIRGESVHRALKDLGVKSELIWVAEDMDPLRKIPNGVPESFSKYIGMPVSDIPDPWGCHKTYAEHHISEYLEVIDEFVATRMKRFYMSEEYRKGSFNRFIKILMEPENIEKIISILNRFRREPFQTKAWSPWTPICENCGKIITPAIEEITSEGLVRYTCRDYSFEKTTAKGCGHRGTADPLKDGGKLMWKSEWAAQWAYWKVVSEGAGKEYQVPGSAFWVNGEIVEKVLDFPMPVPIFYEHLMIDGKKMSASLGNVVYPRDWLEVAPPELLRFLYNKKLMKTRSFSWTGLPGLYSEYDKHEEVYFGKKKIENKKEEAHMKRLYEISQVGKPEYHQKVSFEFCVMISQIFGNRFERALEVMERSGHVKNPGKVDIEFLRKRLSYARRWAELYAPEQYRISLVEKPAPGIMQQLSSKQKSALRELCRRLKEKQMTEEEIYSI
ncbi:MAG TPA: lysine--tRNA ligase, partial [Candidatus Aenigmarchaeota archaeon]|nr:lysine--tRNA ligase [Candidatus Aenigmarchaeota archaeon]